MTNQCCSEGADRLHCPKCLRVFLPSGNTAIEQECVRQRAEIELLRTALKTAQQAILEFSHAQEVGPDWYTRGASGMYQQVHLWLGRGLKAVRDALGPYDDNGQYLKETMMGAASSPQQALQSIKELVRDIEPAEKP